MRRSSCLMRRWQQAKGGDGCVVLISGEAGHRQVAYRRDYPRTTEWRATYPPALFLLAPPSGQRSLSGDQPARTGGRLSPRGHGRAAAGQARGGARARRPVTSARPRHCLRLCCQSRLATATRRSTSPRRSARRRRCMRFVAQVEGLGGAAAGAAWWSRTRIGAIRPRAICST